MGKQHTVVGSGIAPAKVIAEGLDDVLEDGDTLGLIWTGKPTSGQEAVFDYVLDNEVSFVMYYEDGQNPPKVFREADEGIVQKSRVPLTKALDDTTGSILYLWDDEENDTSYPGNSLTLIELVDEGKPEGTLILELTNGLAPIEIGEDDPEVTDAKSRYDEGDEEEKDDTDDTRFTKDELEIMQAAAVKRYGERIGTEATTKKGIIAELFPEEGVDEDDEVEVDLSPENLRRTKGDPEADHEKPEDPRKPEFALEQDIEEVLDVLRNFLTAAASGKYSN